MQMLHMIKNKETILNMETQESKYNLPGSTAKALITLTNLCFDTITVTTKTYFSNYFKMSASVTILCLVYFILLCILVSSINWKVSSLKLLEYLWKVGIGQEICKERDSTKIMHQQLCLSLTAWLKNKSIIQQFKNTVLNNS